MGGVLASSGCCDKTLTVSNLREKRAYFSFIGHRLSLRKIRAGAQAEATEKRSLQASA